MKERIKVSDYIFDYLAKIGVRQVFLISGGGNMHLVDSLGRNKDIQYVSNHHEQASSIAAEANARINGNLGVCLVTTGPGVTNALTGTLGAWLDSIPVLYISGQVKQETQAQPPLRQLGDQEANTIELVKSITKYAVMIEKPEDVAYHLTKAVFLATTGRPGPVWLDVPLDIQGAHVDQAMLKPFTEAEKEGLLVKTDKAILRQQVRDVVQKLKKAKRPVLFAGHGIRLAGAAEQLQSVIGKLQIPVLSSFTGFDLVDSTNPYYFGRPGTIGQRAANFIIQNSDFLLNVGSRLNLRIISFNYQAFAREAYKVMVDIDPAEIHKKTLKIDLPIQAHVQDFFEILLEEIGDKPLTEKTEWLDYCRRINDQYPLVSPSQRRTAGFASAYHFQDVLSDVLDERAVVAMGDGMACVIPYKVFKVKFGQRLILNSGCAAMGYDVPAAIGACFASDKKTTVCIAGDGSIMLNLQELQTIVHHKLPIKIFVLLNDGYLSIRTTQDSHFGGFRVASDSASGVSCPDFIKVAEAFGLASETIKNNEEAEEKIRKVMEKQGPVICTVNLDPNELMLPKLSSAIRSDGSMISKPLEDLYPFLPREEFEKNMIIDLWPED